MNCGNKQNCHWKWSEQSVEEDGYGYTIGVFVVFEAVFSEVQCGYSAKAKSAFFAVVTRSKAAKKLYTP